MLEISNLCAGYGKRFVLEQLDLTIPQGQLTVILGPNGCGKSTLLKAICGFLPNTSGTVLLDGVSMLPLSSQKRAQKIAYLSQSRQVPDITARRLVLHGRFPYLSYPRRYRQADFEIADRVMAQLDLTTLAETPLQQMSGGQRQKVYIAMALAQDAQVVLLDEPTASLDIGHQFQLMQLAKQLCSRGKTVVMVLHDLPMALQEADHIVVMRQGKIICTGAPSAILESGMLQQVFGVRIGSVRSEDGQHFYYRGESK